MWGLECLLTSKWRYGIGDWNTNLKFWKESRTETIFYLSLSLFTYLSSFRAMRLNEVSWEKKGVQNKALQIEIKKRKMASKRDKEELTNMVE